MTGIEDRYAYYRRCQVIRRNGEQCKAPAMKGMHICYKHLERAEMEERWKRQRQELLARPGLGFGDFRSLQRTIRAAAQAVIDGSIDLKVAGRLAVDLQMAARLLRVLERNQILPRMNADQRRSEQNKELTTEMRRADKKQAIIHKHCELKCSARQGRPRTVLKREDRLFKFSKMHSENSHIRRRCHIIRRQNHYFRTGISKAFISSIGWRANPTRITSTANGSRLTAYALR